MREMRRFGFEKNQSRCSGWVGGRPLSKMHSFLKQGSSPPPIPGHNDFVKKVGHEPFPLFWEKSQIQAFLKKRGVPFRGELF